MTDTEKLIQEGPNKTVRYNCGDCKFHQTEHYAVQGDSGYDHHCLHPEVEGNPKYFSCYSDSTPDFCPFLSLQIKDK